MWRHLGGLLLLLALTRVLLLNMQSDIVPTVLLVELGKLPWKMADRIMDYWTSLAPEWLQKATILLAIPFAAIAYIAATFFHDLGVYWLRDYLIDPRTYIAGLLMLSTAVYSSELYTYLSRRRNKRH